MYIILSHPAYNTPKFKIYADIPQEFKTASHAPQVLTTALTFSTLYTTTPEQRWSGDRAAAAIQIPHCIEIGGNPLIVRSDAVKFFNPEPLKTIEIPRNSILSVYNDLLDIVRVRKDHDGLLAKLAKSIGYGREWLELTEHELKQLHSIMGITQIIKQATAPIDPDIPPRDQPLFDLSQCDEEPHPPSNFPLDASGEPILPPELANIEPALPPTAIPTLRPPESIAFGASKGDNLRSNRTRRRKA